MKKLNNKGYMIVEIIVASVLAMTIAYFLFDLVIKLKDKYDYVQTDTILTADKTVITNEILGDLYNQDIKCATAYPLIKKMEYTLNDGTTTLTLSYDDNKIIKYESSDSTVGTIYQKKLSDKLQTSTISINCENDIASFIVEASTLTSKKNYNINIIIPVSCNCPT